MIFQLPKNIEKMLIKRELQNGLVKNIFYPFLILGFGATYWKEPRYWKQRIKSIPK